MGIRETLKQKPWIGVVLTIAFIAIAGAVTLQTRGLGKVSVADTAFFTIDDGETTFVADRNLLPPFEYEGKQAVKAHVFSCDGGKTTFVAYLSKLDEKVKNRYEQEVEQAKAKGATPPRAPMGFLVKKVGGTEWVSSMDPRRKSITDVDCKGAIPEIVHPR